MALNTVSSDRLSTNVKNTNFTDAEKQDLTDDIKPLLGSSGGGNKNKIINGSMIVSQRGTSFAAANNIYTLDRFRIQGSHDGAVTVTQSSTSPDGFANSLKVDVTTADTSIASGQYLQLVNKVEAQDLQDLAYGTSSAKTITVSFYVRSTLTGTYTFAMQQPDGSNRQMSQTYTINSANTWERKTFTVPGDTSGLFNNDNGVGLQMYWNLAIGSQYTSGSSSLSFTTYSDANFAAGHTANLLSSTSNDFYLTGIQLEVSSVVTEYDHRSFQQELDLCKRYFQVIAKHNSHGNGAIFFAIGKGHGSGQVEVVYRYEKEMRAPPTLEQGTGTNYYQFSAQGVAVNFSSYLLYLPSIHSTLMYQSVGSGTTNGFAYNAITNNVGAYLHLSAEL